MNAILESAIHKLQWGATQGHWSVDLSSEECAAILEEMERLSATVLVEIVEPGEVLA